MKAVSSVIPSTLDHLTFAIIQYATTNDESLFSLQPLSEAFDKWGVTCVEHIKLLPRDDFLQIFEEEKFIVKETAKLVFDMLHETPFDPSRAAVKREGAPYVPPAAGVATPPLGTTPKRLLALPTNDQEHTSIDAKELKALDSPQQLECVARMWNFKGHQTNFVRLAVAEVLGQGYTKTGIFFLWLRPLFLLISANENLLLHHRYSQGDSIAMRRWMGWLC